ncbi:bifunctional hydroxymethylpyrimidine kinase/phosphomethylpyrimidine kinase [Companilactobacillus sp. DQM5]|uniref:bifunctional hydroxymethylpyrimidine kinase/phosphomethylpyrimidine kinase n=1 Tax=Companilactobacillus sp. DQM5 TaxID=3463359 RepID=UPI004058896C
MKNVVTIAGSDILSGGGLQADLKTFEELDTFGISAVTCLTTLDKKNNFQITNLPTDIVKKEFESILQNVSFDALKLGLINSNDTLNYLADRLKEFSFKIITDPVFTFKETSDSLSSEYIEIFKKKILPLSTIVTPNLLEAKLLSGMKSLKNIEDLKKAAEIIQSYGVKNVVIKGGTSFDDEDAIDYALLNNSSIILKKPKINSKNINGAGCTFSSVLTAEIAKNNSIEKSVTFAKEFVFNGIKYGVSINDNFGNVWQGGYRYRNREKERK